MNYTNYFPFSEEKLLSFINYALSFGSDYCDIYFEHSFSSNYFLEDNIIKTASSGITQGVGIRLIDGEQVGYTYTDEINEKKILEAIKTASYIISSNNKNKVANLNINSTNNLYPISKPYYDISINDKLSLLKTANQSASNYSPLIKKVKVSYSDEIKNILIVSSDGKITYDYQPMIILRVNCLAQQGSNFQSGSNSYSNRNEFSKLDVKSVESLAEKASSLAILNLDATDAPSGQLEVVLGSGDSGVLLHEAVGHGLEADFNRKNLSYYSGKIGQKVASELCTVIDDGTIKFARGSINYDDEGNISNKNYLIKDGILVGYLHDRISSIIMKTNITGNGRRQSYQHPPIPRMTNTYMENGKYHPDEIINSVKYGIYAKRFAGGQVDITKGDFVFGVEESYLIEDGMITAPLKNVTLIGNGPDIMNKVVMVGHDLKMAEGGWTCGKQAQRVPVGQGMPTVKISSMTVGGTKIS